MFSYEQLKDKLILSGELTRHTLNAKNYQDINTVLKTKKLIIDLAAVSKTDTAGLAWLLFLVEQTKKTNSELFFVNVNDDLIKLAKLSSADSLLPIQIN